MRTRFLQSLLALLLITMIGGHWALLQSVAWVGMAVRFSQDTTLADALRKTFDGEHPCKVCQLVKAGKQAEKKQDSVTRKVETRLESCLANRFILPDAPARTHVLPAGAAFLRLRSEPPLTPPPRLA